MSHPKKCETIPKSISSENSNVCFFIFISISLFFFLTPSLTQSLYHASIFCLLIIFSFSFFLLTCVCGNFISDFHFFTKLHFFPLFFHSIGAYLWFSYSSPRNSYLTSTKSNYLHFILFCFFSLSLSLSLLSI